jgi:hypothetical protein
MVKPLSLHPTVDSMTVDLLRPTLAAMLPMYKSRLKIVMTWKCTTTIYINMLNDTQWSWLENRNEFRQGAH